MILIRNRFEFRSLAEQAANKNSEQILVSICIPARNEESGIERCVRSACEQDYENIEVLVLDDQSTDSTSQILKKLTRNYPKLSLYSGAAKPQNWLGKSWACYQLSEYAKGDILIFIDADVWLEKNAISKVLPSFGKFDAVTIWPQQMVGSFWENLIVPTIYFSLLTLLPSTYVERSPRWLPSRLNPILNPKFAAGCGQFFGFTRKAYQSIEGHSSVKNKVVEDIELARNLKKSGHTLTMMNGLATVYCRMYSNHASIWQGFRKNFLAGFGNIFEFLVMGLVHFIVFILPIISLVLSIINNLPHVVLLSSSALILAILQRYILSHWFKWNTMYSAFHLFAVLWFQLLAVQCIFDKIFNRKSMWKNRPV